MDQRQKEIHKSNSCHSKSDRRIIKGHLVCCFVFVLSMVRARVNERVTGALSIGPSDEWDEEKNLHLTVDVHDELQ